jgi:hypothetical protein
MINVKVSLPFSSKRHSIKRGAHNHCSQFQCTFAGSGYVSRKKSVTDRDVDCNVTVSSCMCIMFFRVFALKVIQLEKLQRWNLRFRPLPISTKFITPLHCEMEEIQNKRGRAFLFALLGREVSLV